MAMPSCGFRELDQRTPHQVKWAWIKVHAKLRRPRLYDDMQVTRTREHRRNTPVAFKRPTPLPLPLHHAHTTSPDTTCFFAKPGF